MVTIYERRTPDPVDLWLVCTQQMWIMRERRKERRRISWFLRPPPRLSQDQMWSHSEYRYRTSDTNIDGGKVAAWGSRLVASELTTRNKMTHKTVTQDPYLCMSILNTCSLIVKWRNRKTISRMCRLAKISVPLQTLNTATTCGTCLRWLTLEHTLRSESKISRTYNTHLSSANVLLRTPRA
jgi:hypothetical protein